MTLSFNFFRESSNAFKDDGSESTGHECNHTAKESKELIFEDTVAEIQRLFDIDYTYEAFTLLDELSK